MKQPISPASTYLKVGVTLLILLALTVATSLVDLGPWNTIISLAIAAAKAVLIILFFMHMRFSNRLNWVYVLVGLFWLLLLFGLTLGDYLTRSWLPGR